MVNLHTKSLLRIPYYVHEYISSVIARSKGLTIDTETGIVTEYNGNADNVIIPEYVSVNNGDGTYSAVRIRGIAKDVFKGNTSIKGVYLPKYIYEIPESAFEGCTSLETIIGYGVSSIKDNAFSGCKSLKKFKVDEYIKTLGKNAFDGVKEISVTAENPSVAESAINSNTKRITLDVSKMTGSFDNKKIVVGDSVEYFALISNAKSYKNLSIQSDAYETFISNMTFTDNTDVPLKLSSAVVTLNRVKVEKAPGFALVLINAQWQQKSVSGWVKASQAPSGAQITNRKYTYTLTSYTTSSSSSLSGWTKYNTTSAWSDYGSWSAWQDGAVSSSDSRQVQTQSVVASYNYKTVYHYYYYSKSETNGYTSYTATDAYGKNRYTVTFDSALPKDGTVSGHQKYKWSNHHGSGKYMYVYADSPYTTQEVVSTNYKTQYRYRDRHLVYTYYYKKDESKESSGYPSGSNISNIQEWVQYRAK